MLKFEQEILKLIETEGLNITGLRFESRQLLSF